MRYTLDMHLDVCIAHAIHQDLDIMEALPQLAVAKLEEIAPMVERYVLKLQSSFAETLSGPAKHLLDAGEPIKLACACLMANVPAPLPSLRKMCQTIVELYGIQSRLVGTRDGKPIYEVDMNVRFPEPFSATMAA